MSQTMSHIDFYFDFASPYGYFMSEKIEELANQHGRSVTWRPILLFAALRSLGLSPPFEHPIKLDYITADFKRSAKFLGVDYRLPSAFPALTQHAARAFYLLNEKAPTSAVPYAHSVFRSYFRDSKDISNIEFIAQMVLDQTDSLGTRPVIVELLKSDATKSLLNSAIDAAVENRVFGSPFIIIDGESFFGVDRLPQIDQKLALIARFRDDSPTGD